MNYPQLNLENEKGPEATIKTNYGEMQFQLFPEIAPKAVENFVGLSKKGYYDGVIFHRVIKDFPPFGIGKNTEIFLGRLRQLGLGFRIIGSQQTPCTAHSSRQ